MKVLVYPATVPECQRFLTHLGESNVPYVAATSDPISDEDSIWPRPRRLPSVYDRGFLENLLDLIEHERISDIYTSHTVVYHFLDRHKESLPANVNLLGRHPVALQMADVKRRTKDRWAVDLPSDSPMLTEHTYPPMYVPSLIAGANNIYGECSNEKILGFCHVASHTSAGDVVEVGSFFGKSAWVLSRLADFNNLGVTLAIDPWSNEQALQYDSPAILRDLASQWDWDAVFQGFLLNLSATTRRGTFNYLRATSIEASKLYARQRVVHSAEFGSTVLSGGISILHIDGNHDEACVREDYRVWESALVPGGWLVLDDVEWSGGNGPSRVAREVNDEVGSRFSQSFVRGGALFAQTVQR